MATSSVFSAMPIESPGRGKTVIAASWCGAKEPALLAVAVEGGTVLVLEEDGTLHDEVIRNRPFNDPDHRSAPQMSAATCLSWSTAQLSGGTVLLAIGWNDGSVMVWSEKDRMQRVDDEQHSLQPISFVAFTPDNSRLVSGDCRPVSSTRAQDAAVLCMWKVDNKGRFTAISPYKRPSAGALTHALFRTAEAKKKLVTSAFAAADTPPVYFGGDAGVVCMGDDLGRSSDVIPSLGAALAAMLYIQERDLLVVITVQNHLSTWKLTDNKPVAMLKTKLSVGRDGLMDSCWCGLGLLACVSNDQVVRVNDLIEDNEADDNFILTLADVPGMENKSDKLTTLAYQSSKRMLAAGTKDGRVVVWKHTGNAPSDAPEKGWTPLPPVETGSQPTKLSWSSTDSLLAVCSAGGLHLCPETVLRRAMRGEWALLQLDAHNVAIEHVDGAVVRLETEARIAGCDLFGCHLLVWTTRNVFVYKFDDSTTTAEPAGAPPPVLLNSFEHRCTAGAIYKETVFLSAPGRVDVATFHGSIVATLPFADSEGNPTHMHLAANARTAHLVAGTDKGFIKAWDVGRREPRQHAAGRKLAEGLPKDALSRVSALCMSTDGLRIAATVDTQPAPPNKTGIGANKPPVPTGGWRPDGKLYVFLVDADVAVSHSFNEAGRTPSAFYWEESDPKLIGVETRPIPFVASDGGKTPGAAAAAAPAAAPVVATGGGAVADLEVTTLFCTPEGELRKQNTFDVPPNLSGLIATRVPHFYFVGGGDAAAVDLSDEPAGTGGGGGGAGGRRLRGEVMRDFVGMEAVDEPTRKALVDFSYFLTIGNLDEAHKAVKLVKSTAVWENMARMCVKTKRLDIADVCLGNMGHARGARAVREAVEKHTDKDGNLTEPDVCAAVVAVQLGLLAEAERLYEGCGRYDLLNELYQASGKWDKALAIAKDKDRIHLKSTHYAYARELEASGKTKEALSHFEESGTHRVEVPRMLFDAQQIGELNAYVDQTADTELLRWWAQYAESNARFREALQYYERAGDHLAIVRVLCFHKKFDRAAEVVEASGDLGAAYHLAKQYEAKDDIKKAIQYYQRAQRFNHAIRLARTHDMAGELNMMAINAPPKQMSEAAAYFESRGQEDRAVMLYQKSGQTAKAVELCFRSRLFDQLREIAEHLPSGADPALFKSCAEFFLDHGQYEKTVRLFAKSGEYSKALDLCVMHSLPLSEELAEQMCPEKKEILDEANAEDNNILLKVAKVLKRQGNYHLASKKYTQAGDKVKAMKCLLKSGDTQKICYFAGVSRNKDIYILAANYLQNLDWKADPDIVKNIVQFYSKAKALEQLSAFFDACAQVEIDDYRDYEKALAALKEAHEWLTKARSAGKEGKAASLGLRVQHVENFVNARKLVKTDPETTVKMCFDLLDQPEVENALRVGDVYALMVEWFHSQSQYQQAYDLITKMVARNIVLAPYLDQEMVNTICASMGVPVPTEPTPAPPQPAADADADEVDDNIEEDFDD